MDKVSHAEEAVLHTQSNLTDDVDFAVHSGEQPNNVAVTSPAPMSTTSTTKIGLRSLFHLPSGAKGKDHAGGHEKPENGAPGYSKTASMLKLAGLARLKPIQRPGRHARLSKVPEKFDIETSAGKTGKTSVITVLRADRTTKTYHGAEAVYADREWFARACANKEFFWVDVSAPNTDDLAVMEDLFHVHPLTTEDVLGTFTREKVETYDLYLFVVLQAPAGTDSYNRQEQNIHICTYDTFALTFHAHAAQPIEKTLSDFCHNNSPLQADWVLYSIIDTTTDLLEPEANAIEGEVDAIDEMIFSLGQQDQADALRRIDMACKQLSSLNQRLKPKRDLLAILAGAGRDLPAHVSRETMLYLRDTLDLVRQLMGKVEASRTVINGTQASYFAQINVEMSAYQHQSSEAMGKLAVASVVFLPLTLVAGMFGQNVRVPFQGGEDGIETNTTFIVICVLNVVMAGAIVAWAKRAKLI
eukprot:comp4939_c0_seq1/m.1027 comp4939_c0_seq1/g.1027  ORF comp4939_c0_seq1/g.1027 comp4939_c0_seq1/m.1027 type:complete len:471 (-) comp4939_c0_seq1:595-2007(-)